MEKVLRQYIRVLLREEPEVLGEPDFPDDEESEELKKDQEEASVSSGIAGVVTPLGTGPKYPDDDEGRRSPAAAAGSAFGGAKPYKANTTKQKNKN